MSNHNTKEIKSLEHTIKCHRSYIQELQTKHYRGAVTDNRIETMNKQIQECETTIERLKHGQNTTIQLCSELSNRFT